jgi:hypothetical protein
MPMVKAMDFSGAVARAGENCWRKAPIGPYALLK